MRTWHTLTGVTAEEPLATLLRSVLVRVEELVAGEERVRALLDAVNAVAGDLDLHATLERIVTAAAGLADAQYAALGVIDPSGDGLVDFITYGMSAQTVGAIGAQPRGSRHLGADHRGAGAAAAARSQRASGVVRHPEAPPADALVPGGTGPGP